MEKKILCVLALTLGVVFAKAQNSIGINTDSPNPNAALDIQPASGQTQGLLIPRISTAQRTGMSLAGTDDGLMVFDTDEGKLFMWFNANWNPSGSQIWEENAGDINYAAGNVGIGTTAPRSPLQVEQSLSLFNFQNSTNSIFGDFVGSNLYVDKTDAVNNGIRRMSGGNGSFIFFETTGQIKFLHSATGAADANVDLTSEVKSSLSLNEDGTADFDGLVTFKTDEAIVLPFGDDVARDAIAVPLDGMLRYSNESGSEGFEGRVLGSWVPIGGGGGLTLPYSDAVASSAVPLFDLINTEPSGGVTASFGNSSNLDPVLQLFTDIAGPGATGATGGISLAGIDDGGSFQDAAVIRTNIIDGMAGSFSGSLEFEVSNGAVLNPALILKHDGDAEFPGAVKFGSTSNTLTSGDEGTLRYVSGVGFEYWDGAGYQSLGGGSITGGTNGLNVNGSNIELGGSLSTNTNITSNGFEMTFVRGAITPAPTIHLFNNNTTVGAGANLVFETTNDGSTPLANANIEARKKTTADGELALRVLNGGALNDAITIDGENDDIDIGAGYSLKLNGPMVNTPPVTATSGAINPSHRVMKITGTVTGINAGQEGQELILVSEGGGTVTINDGSFLQTGSAAGDVMMFADFSTVHLLYINGQWIELSRSFK